MDLRLPLLRPNEARRGELGQDFLGGPGAAEQFVERATAGHAFAAFGGEDQRAAFLQHPGTGAHALDTLVKVEIQRVAAVGRYDDVERLLDRLHRGPFHKGAAGPVRLEDVAGEDIGDVALLVERDVEYEAWPGLEGDVAQFLPERVAVGDTEGRTRVAYVFRAVIAHHRLQPGAARHDAFHAATEPGEKMRLDEPGDDPQVGLDDVPVEQGGGAVGRRADLHEGFGIFRLVVEYAVVGDDLRRQQRLEFLARVGPVGAELVEQRDVVAWPAEMLE